MYRISRVFETSSVAIVKLAGQLQDSDAQLWSEFLHELEVTSNGWVVLDFSEVSRMGRKAIDTLVELLPQCVLLLNCPNTMKNLLDAAGLSNHILEPAGTAGRTRLQCFLELQPSSNLASHMESAAS